MKTNKVNATKTAVGVIASDAKLTQTGTPEASAGVSMAAMIAAAVKAALADALPNGVAPIAAVANVVEVPKAATMRPSVKTAPKTATAKPASVAKVAQVQRVAVQQTANEKPVFDPRSYYALGADLVATEDGSKYIAQSSATGLLLIVGVTRKAVALTLEQAELMRDLLNGIEFPKA